MVIEDQESISAWADQTFGPGYHVRDKMNALR